MMTLLAVMAGGAVGSGLRWGLGLALPPMGNGLPIGTLSANLLGCLAIGLLSTWFAGSMQVSEPIRLGILVGVLGGFTTFSSFGSETLMLLDAGRYGIAGVYVLLSNVGGLFLAWMGTRIAQG